MILQDVGKQLSHIQIEAFEKDLKITLPQDYKDFLLKNNGGYVAHGGTFDFVEEPYQKPTNTTILYFTMIQEGELESYLEIKSSYIALAQSGQTPLGLLPIADDVCGNVMMMSVAREDYGKIYFANHEMEDPETGYLLMSLVANSFSELINICYEYADDE